MKNHLGSGTLLAAVALASAISASATRAAVIDLTFEGLKNLEPVSSYYNGGMGGFGSGPGPNDGITFSASASASISDQSGGGGHYDANAASSGITTLYSPTSGDITLDDAAGFQTGFSVFYSAINNPGSLYVYSGLDATGAILGFLSLPLTPAPSSDRYQPFVAAGLTFAGTAHSASLLGAVNHIGFDDVTLGSATPGPALVPEPASLALLASGLFGLCLLRRRT